MACASHTAASATITVTEDVDVESPNTKKQRTEDEEAQQAPMLDDILVALDVAAMGWQHDKEAEEVENTIKALIVRAKLDGIPLRKALGLAMLIAFKRRNHAASQAPGMGAGERELLRTILRAIARVEPEMVRLVLPLIPLYGSYRDLLVLAEQMMDEHDRLHGMGPGLVLETGAEELPFLVDAICALFAEQMMHDEASGASSSSDEPTPLPSNAAKYCPHEGRHQGKKEQAAKARAVSKRLGDGVARKLSLGGGFKAKPGGGGGGGAQPGDA